MVKISETLNDIGEVVSSNCRSGKLSFNSAVNKYLFDIRKIIGSERTEMMSAFTGFNRHCLYGQYALGKLNLLVKRYGKPYETVRPL